MLEKTTAAAVDACISKLFTFSTEGEVRSECVRERERERKRERERERERKSHRQEEVHGGRGRLYF